MDLKGIQFRKQEGVISTYKGVALPISFRADFFVEDRLIVELKAVEDLTEIHTAQVLTYLKLTDVRLGLLINFNVPALWRGVRRVVNHL